MAELNGNLPMLSSLAQSGSTRAGSDLARAFSSSHNGLPVITSSKDILPAVVNEPNEAGYSVASALASNLPGLQERARISELAQEAHLGRAGLQGTDGHASSSAINTGAGVLAHMHDIVFHEADPYDPSKQGKPEPGSPQHRHSGHGESTAAIVGDGKSGGLATDAGRADENEDRPDKALAAVNYTVPSGPAKMPRWHVAPKLASSDHLGAPRKIFETAWANDQEMRMQLQAASVAGLAGAATKRLLLQASDG